MPRVSLGLGLGIACGVIDILLMLPLDFPDKRAALLAAFCARSWLSSALFKARR